MNQQIIIRNRNYYKNRLKIILTYLNLNNKSVLDLGCGEMILYDLVKHEVTSYIGIDSISYSNDVHFVHANILDPDVLESYTAEFIFLLGVLDHISPDEKNRILELCKTRYSDSLIISQKNPHSFINMFYKKTSPVVDVEEHFKDHRITKVYLLKLPFNGWVFDLSRSGNRIKNWCTEIIYIITKSNQ